MYLWLNFLKSYMTLIYGWVSKCAELSDNIFLPSEPRVPSTLDSICRDLTTKKFYHLKISNSCSDLHFRSA